MSRVLACCVLFGCLWAASPTMAITNKAIWGPLTMPDGSSAIDVYRSLGVRTLQVGLPWAEIAPLRPAIPRSPADVAYAWPAGLGKAITDARRAKLRIAFLVNQSPPWANGNRPSEWAPSPKAYANFITAAARRYPSVRHWMIWGEPNRAAVFQPLPVNSRRGPRRYARLLAAAYKALKRENSRNIVIGGMTFSFGEVRPRDFANWMRLPNGKPAPLDWYGHNPFTRRFPDLSDHGYAGYPGARDIGDIDLFHRELSDLYRPHYKRFRKSGPKLWLSEFTISSDRGNHAFNFYVSRRTQARWLTAAYRIANRSPFVAGLGWFNLLDEPPSVPDGLTTGLMTWDGRPKPAYYAYKRAP